MKPRRFEAAASGRYGRTVADRTDDLNDAVRELIDVVRTADLSEVDLDTAIAQVTAIADGLRPYVVPGLRMQATLHMSEEFMAHRDEEVPVGMGDADPADFFPYSPVIGAKNPIAPPVHMWRVPADSGIEMHGEVTMRAAYNGPPGSVHGGIIAEVMDELLGATAVCNDAAGFTGTLTVIYRSPTPLEEPLTMRGWIDRIEGRKTFAKGEIRHGEVLCAEAEGIFIGFDRDEFVRRRTADLG